MSSYRIGRRRKAGANTLSESEILRSLFELRKRCNEYSYSTALQEVTELTFWNCQWTERIVNSLRKLVVRDGHCFSSVKFFDCGIKSPKFVEVISMILSHNATTELVIKERKLLENRNESSEQFLPRCRSSTASSPVDRAFFAAIRDGISANSSLKYLKLSGLNFTNATTTTTYDVTMENSDNLDNFVNGNEYLWCYSLINNNSLLHLDLSDSSFSKSSISSLSSALSLNTTLQSLNFGRCGLGDQLLSQILRSVKEHPSLIKLDLSQNFLAKSTSTKALNAITELLRSSDSKLECLDLSNQQLPRPNTVTALIDISTERSETEEKSKVDVSLEKSETEERSKVAFKNALNALSTNVNLRSINLSGNSSCFSDLDNVKALSSCLVTNTGLTHVDVSSCHLNPLGISYLAQRCIPRCDGNLKSLVLFDDEVNNNSIKNENMTTILASLERSLQFNSTLESLGELDNIGLNFKLRSSLQHLLNLNRAGRRALQTDGLPLAAWPNILARASRIEYDNCHDGRNNGDDSDEVKESLSTITSASVLFTLLHGPVMLERRRK